MELREKIKNRRIELHLTLEDVAHTVGVSSATVSRWESGEIASLRGDKIALLAQTLQVTPAYLMDWSTQSAVPSQLDKVYFNFAREAQENDIDPDDIKLAIDIIKKLRRS
ncbi:helix-turn-helix transcriptional regulator [Clostridium sp. D33t1_170424_F3]|uniref:helix-turn-helix domain-containing protein n=1 Tax=Clostridium sp. D33t1_170424_F3 TaxID=2787099 RepID=UPI0018A9AAE0|nr:helix-turn-helix transcriptional regulator [Clostridium sp. D33t1_170424_F3]